MAEKIKVGIIGGAGYTGGELIRILLNHPQVEIVFTNSKSNAGNFISDVHTDLLGDTQLKFSTEVSNAIDVLFLCLGHGDSAKYLKTNPFDDRIKIIDLSQDFRLRSHATLDNRTFVYGLPELNKEAIKKAKNIANPGCFATAIQLSILPLAAGHLLNEEVHISGVTGSTGAGQSLSETSHFSWRNNNFSAYKIMDHQHLKEITESLCSLQKSLDKKINFIPYRGNFTRGIMITSYTKSNLTLEAAKTLYQNYYKDHPFVHISNTNPHLKQVVNTNKCILYLEKHEDTLVVISLIDNLTKGASGQAVQNMNLLFGMEETAGLRLKTVGF
jgi:N-acetyl-gamma-glutamyl-phosphate reductase